MIDLNQILSYGGTMVGGGVIGFALGYAVKKIIKLALLGFGLVLALLAFLQYKGWINVNWNIVQQQSNDLARQGAQQLSSTLNTASAGLQHSQMDLLYPALGIIGFMPGVCAGFIKG
jgi:uncharacterized membrane protein (Fun14 family)